MAKDQRVSKRWPSIRGLLIVEKSSKFLFMIRITMVHLITESLTKVETWKCDILGIKNDQLKTLKIWIC